MKNMEIQDLKLSENPRVDKLLNCVVHELRSFTEEQARNLNELSKIGKALSAQKNISEVLEMILSQARRFTNADGGTLYLLDSQKRNLDFHVLHSNSLNTFMGGTSGKEVTLPPVPLFTEDNKLNNQNVSAYVANSGETINIPDVYIAEGFNFDGTKKFDKSLNYRSMSMLVVPMRDHEEEIIGVLQLINALDKVTGKTIAFSEEIVDMVGSLASQAAVVLTQQKLIEDLRNLFESFIKAIATAIDEKSKYTGGHIERVAELTLMIAEKVNSLDDGIYADIHFDKDNMDAIRIAAWMHDTGKITTPEYVVDKATKLETVFDRVELLKTRWELMIEQRKNKANEEKLRVFQDNADLSLIQKIDEKCAEDIKILNDEIEFLVKTNTGGEFMRDEDLEKLANIARKTYIYNGETHNYLSKNEHENLSIRKGTLTFEERQIINNHATMTIEILNQLDWPRKLSGVPEIAGGHHEKLDGTGYPNGLTAEELPLEARILAVADIFEALSARDRPYKDPMPLSQAIKILGFMVKDGHIDKDLVDMFISSGLCLEYANKYLSDKQIDIEL